jgi:hypothetical protein
MHWKLKISYCKSKRHFTHLTPKHPSLVMQYPVSLSLVVGWMTRNCHWLSLPGIKRRVSEYCTHRTRLRRSLISKFKLQLLLNVYHVFNIIKSKRKSNHLSRRLTISLVPTITWGQILTVSLLFCIIPC